MRGPLALPALPVSGAGLLEELRRSGALTWTASAAKQAIRFLAQHTGLPALVVAAVLVVAGFRLLKRSARFAAEVAFVTLLLVTATELGWIHW